jgi:hypothetical protein
MSKILILAQSGFGKSTSIGSVPEFNIKGLNPSETFVISVTNKPLPFAKSNSLYKICDVNGPPVNGNRVISNNPDIICKVLSYVSLKREGIKNIIIDDSNYIMQDYYMRNSLKKGYDVFKEIGKFMSDIFESMETNPSMDYYVFAHYEEFKDSNSDTISYRYKTVGNMVNNYLTPEGKFEIVLYGKQTYDESTKASKKVFVTNYDGQYPAKTPIGMFKDLYIPNDLRLVSDAIENYY